MGMFQVNACESVSCVSAALSKSLPPVEWTPRPATNIIIADTNREGNVVHNRCFICVSTFPWRMAAARLVSRQRDSLSPKQALLTKANTHLLISYVNQQSDNFTYALNDLDFIKSNLPPFSCSEAIKLHEPYLCRNLVEIPPSRAKADSYLTEPLFSELTPIELPIHTVSR